MEVLSGHCFLPSTIWYGKSQKIEKTISEGNGFMKKVVGYDFDKTLTYKDTLLGYFCECAPKNFFYVPKLACYFVGMVAAKLGLLSNTDLKKVGIFLFLKGQSKEDVEAAARKYQNKIEFNRLYKELKFEEDFEHIVISASFEEYLRILFPSHVKIVASKLAYKDGKVVGLARNCYSSAKEAMLKEEGIKKLTLFYTDSYSDLPIAKMAEKTVVVKGDTLQECLGIDAFRECFDK